MNSPHSSSDSFSKFFSNKQINSKSRAMNLNSEFNSVFSINNSNMDSIEKKIKNKYNSALEYIDNLNNKRAFSKPQNSFYIDKLTDYKKDMLFSFINSPNTSNRRNMRINLDYNNNDYKTSIIYKTNNNINNNLTSQNRNKSKDKLMKKINNILYNSQRRNESDEKKINKTMIYNKSQIIKNEKAKDKIKQIYEILKPEKDPKKRAMHYEIFDETLQAFKLRELRDKKNYPSIIKKFTNGTDDNDYKGKLIKKINPHVDLYDSKKNDIENIQKSVSCQRIMHITKVLDSEVSKNNHFSKINFEDYGLKKKPINLNGKKDLFATSHERIIKNKLIDLSKFSIFPDIMRRKRKDKLLNEYAKNNLQIISGIKNDLAKSDNKNDNNNNNNNIIEKNINNNNLKKKEVKFKEEIQENKINEKEDINIDDLL